jgi:hypothetical protein
LWSVALAGVGSEILLELAGLVFVSICIRESRALGRQVRPFVRLLTVQLKPLLQARLRVGLNGVDRALRLADAAINAFVRVDDEHILAFIETIDRAHLDTIGVLALDALIVDDVSH